MVQFKSLKDHVYDYIANEILIGKLHPEDKINENKICEELAISRTPVREALIQLASEGILDNVPRKGFVVKNMTKKEASELYVILGYLDGLAAKLACPNLTEKNYRDMQFYIDSMYLAIESKNYEMYLQQQRLFHQIYTDLCGNDTLIEEIGKMKNKFLKKSYADDEEGNTYRTLMDTNAEHEEILNLLKENDSDKVFHYLADVHWAPKKSDLDLIPAE